jgi:CheY-like chemotaxis protein
MEITGSTRRVVVIDDNAGDIDLFMEAFRAEKVNVEVKHFTDAQQALDFLCTGEHADLVLSDLNMPHMNGIQLFERMGAHNRLSKIPVAIMSSSSKRLLPESITTKLKVPYFSKATTWTDFLRLARAIDGLMHHNQDIASGSRTAESLADQMITPLPLR